MSSFRIRPRFRQTVDFPQEELLARVNARLEKPDSNCIGTVIPDFIVLKIPPKDQHFWSPQLSLSLEDEENDRTLIRGLYGPNPSVWAIFFFGYAVLGILALFAGIIGMSRLSLDMDASILWLLPVFAAMAIGLYLVAQTGQKLGVAQMFTLHHFFEEVVGEQVEIR